MVPQDINNKLQLARKVVFATTSVFAVVLIILCGLLINRTTSWGYGFYYPFSALGIATAFLTLLTLPPMLFLSIKRKGAVTSMISIEVAWTWFLWILWLSTGGNAAGYNLVGCGGSYYYDYYYGSYYSSSSYGGSCREAQALTAFAFLGWIMLFAYNIALISFVVRLHMRGHTNVWTGYITETDFTAAPAHGNTAGVMQHDPKFAPQYPASSVSSAGPYPGSPNPGYPVNPGYPAAVPHPQHVQAGSPYPQV
jgi:hypothetical protein